MRAEWVKKLVGLVLILTGICAQRTCAQESLIDAAKSGNLARVQALLANGTLTAPSIETSNILLLMAEPDYRYSRPEAEHVIQRLLDMGANLADSTSHPLALAKVYYKDTGKPANSQYDITTLDIFDDVDSIMYFEMMRNPSHYTWFQCLTNIIDAALLGKPLKIPQEARSHWVMGNTAMMALKDANDKSLSDFDEPIHQYQQAVLLAPWWADAYQNLGSALYGRGRFENAIDAWKLYLVAAPQATDAQKQKVLDRISAAQESEKLRGSQ